MTTSASMVDPHTLRWGRYHLPLGGRTLLMGVVNVTPDSFYDGGRYRDPERAVARGLQLTAEGADLLDIGGESTRPGADPVPAEEELRRVLPVIRSLSRQIPIPLSIDTTKAAVAEEALAAGAALINDISGLRFDPALAAVAARREVPLILMHSRGTPRTMQQAPHYDHLLEEIARELREAMAKATASGVPEDRILADPGLGFAKTADHNLQILRELPRLQSLLGRPLVIGPSRKSFLGAVLSSTSALGGQPGGASPAPPEERLEGTLAAVAIAAWHGARIVRVHDVAPALKVVRVVEAIKQGRVS
ncbi:MAG: dihydropteroate synthase [Nitrospirae bacterium]|nr:dihydropteroate synthase [Nitrospirota bacterium]